MRFLVLTKFWLKLTKVCGAFTLVIFECVWERGRREIEWSHMCFTFYFNLNIFSLFPSFQSNNTLHVCELCWIVYGKTKGTFRGNIILSWCSNERTLLFFYFYISTNARMLIFIRRRDQICNFFSLSFSINHTSHLISPQCDFTTNRDSIYYSWAFAVTLVNSLLGLAQLLGLSSQFQWFEPEAQARTKSNNVIVPYYESCLYTHYWPLFNDFVYNFYQFPLYLYL